MKLVFLVLLGIGFILISCNEEENKKVPITKTNSDTVIKEIPEWYRTSGYTQKRDKKLYNLLNLPSLENGFDSFQVRILIDCGYETSNLIIFENKKSQWNAASGFSFAKVFGRRKHNLMMQDATFKKRNSAMRLTKVSSCGLTNMH